MLTHCSSQVRMLLFVCLSVDMAVDCVFAEI
jgi:hypothetical protein